MNPALAAEAHASATPSGVRMKKVHASDLCDELAHTRADTDVVLTDYFDTIVSRQIAPEDIKRLWAKRLAAICGGNAHALYETRSRIETRLCLENAAAGHDSEFHVAACYEAIWREAGEAAFEGLTRERYLGLAAELELELECAFQTTDPDVVTALRQARDAGQAVYLVSDFYLPSTLFRRMLDHHGIEDIFSRVFVSADDLKTKRSGRRYEDILSHLPCPAERSRMIGDNVQADGVQPVLAGIPSLLLARDAQHHRYTILNQSFNDIKKLDQQVSALLAQAGTVFPELSLTLYCFIQRLHAKLLQDGVRDVFFLAREGQFLKRLFDGYQASQGCSDNLRIRSHYFLASRRATFLPSLDSLDKERFHMLFRQYTTLSGKEFLLNLDMSDLADALIPDLPDLDLDARQDDFPSSTVYRALLAHPLFRQEYEQRRQQALAGLGQYLGAFPMQAPEAATLALVDVGWKGTIQDNLSRALSRLPGKAPTKIAGYYLGLVAHGAATPENSKTGLLFDIDHRRRRHYAVFNENRSLFESVLAADHGSARRYVPASAGQPAMVECSDFEETELFQQVIAPLQTRIRSVFQALDALLAVRGHETDWLLRAAERHHLRMVLYPTQLEMDWFSGIFHIENFGVFERSEFASSRRHSSSLPSRLAFFLSLLRRRNRNLGFWPYLTIHDRGGKSMAALYRLYKTYR